MSTHLTPVSATARSPRHLIALLASSALFAACGGSGGGGQFDPGGGPPPDPSSFTYPPGFDPSPAGFFVDANEGGLDNEPRVLSLRWGRLVDVFVQDSATGLRSLQHRDFVVGEDIRTDGVDFLLEINPVIITNDGEVIALDAKVDIDDNAAFRQK